MRKARCCTSALAVGLLVILSVLSGCALVSPGAETPEPTSAETNAPTVDEPTETPTLPPTDAPTDAPTTAPEEPTPSGDDLAYEPVTIPEVGLSLEVPVDWLALASEWAWLPEDGDLRRVGVTWVALEPPQEPEAALLPEGAQIVDSTTTELAFGTARRFDLEVFGEAPEGGDAQAPVESAQIHVLITVDRGGERTALDFYASAPNDEALIALEPVLHHMLNSASLAQAVSEPTAGAAPEAASAAASILAKHLDVAVEAVTLISSEAVDWSDACLGIQQSGQVCAQVITPGYRLVFEVNGQQYEVHTDQTGGSVGIVPGG